MTSVLIYLAVFLYLLPGHVLAQMTTTTVTTIRDPLNYPLKQYAFILGISLVGGLVNFYRRVRSGDLQTPGVSALIGELATSAFAGLLCFWICEYFALAPLLTAACAGLAGHAGGNGIVWAETVSRRWIEKRWGATGPTPLGPPEAREPQ